MDRKERPPPVKIPHHESNEINGSSIGGSIINLWQVSGHLHISFMDIRWTSAGCEKISWNHNFEFRHILLVCLGMGNMGTPTTTPLCVVFQFYPSLA